MLLKTVLEEDCEKGLHELKEEKSEEQYKSYEGNAFEECLKAYIKQAVHMSPVIIYEALFKKLHRKISKLTANLLIKNDLSFWENFVKALENKILGMGALKYFVIRSQDIFVQADGLEIIGGTEGYPRELIIMISELIREIKYKHPRSNLLKSGSYFHNCRLFSVASNLRIDNPRLVHVVHIEQNNTGSINALQGGYAHVDTIANFFPEALQDVLGVGYQVEIIRDGGGSFRLIAFNEELNQQKIAEICNRMSEIFQTYLSDKVSIQDQAQLQIDGFGRMALKDYYPIICDEEIITFTGEFFLSSYVSHLLSEKKSGDKNFSVDLLHNAYTLLLQFK